MRDLRPYAALLEAAYADLLYDVLYEKTAKVRGYLDGFSLRLNVCAAGTVEGYLSGKVKPGRNRAGERYAYGLEMEKLTPNNAEQYLFDVLDVMAGTLEKECQQKP